MTRHHFSFPVVAGIDPGDPLASRKTRMAVYGRLIGELDSNGQHISEQISEIDLTDPEDARVLMPEQGRDILAHFGDDQFLARYQRYKAHIGEWRQQYPKLASVDLRYEQQVVLEMTPGAGGAQTTAVEGKPGADTSQGTDNAPPAKPSAGVKADPGVSAAVHRAPARPKTSREKNKKHPVVQKRTAAAVHTSRSTQPPAPKTNQGN
jgi:cell division protein FtsQ